MSTPGSWRSVVSKYNSMPAGIRKYFVHVPQLAEHYPWDVCLAYQFSRVELAHNLAIYCGIVKLHRANPELARAAVERHHITRAGFQDLYRTVFGGVITAPVLALIDEAEDIRDKIMHGKLVSEANKRKAAVDVLRYAKSFNDRTNTLGGIKPFGDLRGFKGRGKALDRATTRWILKGMGLPA